MITYRVEIAWDGSTYVDEVSYVTSMSVRRGREYNWSSSGRQPMRYGEATLTINNYTRRFDPFYEDGDLYGNLSPGKLVRIYAIDGGVTYPVFAGWVLDIRAGDRRKYQGTITCVDGLYWLAMQNCTAAGPTASYSVASALYDLADMSEWPTIENLTFPFTFPLDLGGIGIADNGDVIASFSTDTNQTILSAMEDVAAAFGGTVYIDAGGAFRYSVRYPDQPETFEITDDDVFEAAPRMPWEVIFNTLSVVPTSGATGTASNSTSVLAYGQRNMEISGNDFIQNATHASNLVLFLSTVTPYERMELYIRSIGDGQRQFGRDLMETIAFTSTIPTIDTTFYVVGVQHEIKPGSNAVTTYYLEESIYQYSTAVGSFPFTFPLTVGW